jgi:hypothetical protein
LGVGKSKSLGVAEVLITLLKPYNLFNKRFKRPKITGYKIKDVVVGIANTSAVFNTPIISVETIRRVLAG